MKGRIIMNDSKNSKKESGKNLVDCLKDAVAILDEQRLLILYLNFDVEATRREREYWKKKAGGK